MLGMDFYIQVSVLSLSVSGVVLEMEAQPDDFRPKVLLSADAPPSHNFLDLEPKASPNPRQANEQAPTHETLELPKSPVDAESDFYNTPLLAMNTTTEEEDTSNLPELPPTLNLTTRVSIPGLGMLEDEILQSRVDNQDTAMETQQISRSNGIALKDTETVSTQTLDIVKNAENNSPNPSPLPDLEAAYAIAEARVDQTQTLFEAPAEGTVDDKALSEAAPPLTSIQIEGYDELVKSQEEYREMADPKAISEIGDAQILAAAPAEGVITSVANPEAAASVQIQHDAPIKPQEADQDMVDVKPFSRTKESRSLYGNQADNTVSDGVIPPASNFLDTSGIPEAIPEPDNPEWEADSSPYQSSSSSVSTDSSSDSSSSEDDSEDDGEDYQLLTAAEQVRILMQEERGSDDEDQGGSSKVKDPISEPSRLRTTNEQPDAIFPIPDITLTSESKVTPLGAVESVVENTVLVKANVAGDYQVLETGSVLCLSNRSIIGVVAETLGRVQQPLYTVRFSNIAAVQEKAVAEKGTEVFYVDEHSSFVFTQALKGIKGSDASNIHDEEVGEYEIEFSDDEKEAEYKRQLKLKKRGRRGGDEGFAKPPRGTLRQHRHNYPNATSDTNYDDASSMISYDDDMGDADAYDEGYTPLARPSNLHEMMGSREAPQESWNPETSRPPQTHNSDSANRRAGHYRGGMRGGRGRGGRSRARGRDRCGFDNRQNRHKDQDGRGPSFQSPHTPHSSQYSSPHPHSQSFQSPQSSAPTSSMPLPAFTDSYSPYQSQSQNFHSYRSSPLGQQPNPFPSWPSSQLSHSHGSQMQLSSHAYPQPQPQCYQSQSPSSSSPNPNPYQPPASHINPALYTATQQQQQQAYGIHPQSQSYPHSISYSNPPARTDGAEQQDAAFTGSGSGSGASTAPGAPDGGGGISDILRRLGSGA